MTKGEFALKVAVNGTLGLLLGLLIVKLLLGALPDRSRLGEPIALYEVTGGVLGDLKAGSDDPADTLGVSVSVLWHEWSSLMPPEVANLVSEFAIATDGDGLHDVAGAVHPIGLVGDGWRLYLDPADALAGRDVLDQVLVHEAGHLLTLTDALTRRSPRTLNLVESQVRCDGPAVHHACLVEGTLMYRWVDTFWRHEDFVESDAIEALAASDPTLRVDALDARYEQVRRRFVDAYAVTNPSEDIASTIEALAVGVEPRSGSVVEAKMAMLEADPLIHAFLEHLRATTRF